MINTVTIVGNLTRDPEIKYTPAGKAVAKISIAHNEKRGEEERVSFFDVEAWGKSAEICQEQLSKGSRVVVNGRLMQDRWQAEDGSNRQRVKITAFTVMDLAGRKCGEQVAG